MRSTMRNALLGGVGVALTTATAAPDFLGHRVSMENFTENISNMAKATKAKASQLYHQANPSQWYQEASEYLGFPAKADSTPHSYMLEAHIAGTYHKPMLVSVEGPHGAAYIKAPHGKGKWQHELRGEGATVDMVTDAEGHPMFKVHANGSSGTANIEFSVKGTKGLVGSGLSSYVHIVNVKTVLDEAVAVEGKDVAVSLMTGEAFRFDINDQSASTGYIWKVEVCEDEALPLAKLQKMEPPLQSHTPRIGQAHTTSYTLTAMHPGTVHVCVEQTPPGSEKPITSFKITTTIEKSPQPLHEPADYANYDMEPETLDVTTLKKSAKLEAITKGNATYDLFIDDADLGNPHRIVMKTNSEVRVKLPGHSGTPNAWKPAECGDGEAMTDLVDVSPPFWVVEEGSMLGGKVQIVFSVDSRDAVGETKVCFQMGSGETLKKAKVTVVVAKHVMLLQSYPLGKLAVKRTHADTLELEVGDEAYLLIPDVFKGHMSLPGASNEAWDMTGTGFYVHAFTAQKVTGQHPAKMSGWVPANGMPGSGKVAVFYLQVTEPMAGGH